MNYVHKKRLLKLADFLDKLPPEKFDFDKIVYGSELPNKTLSCGSVGCAIGWCPVVFPRLVMYEQYDTDSDSGIRVKHRISGYDNYRYIARELFGVNPHREAFALFSPGWDGDMEREVLGLPDIGSDATPKQVAKNIRKFVAIKTKEAKK